MSVFGRVLVLFAAVFLVAGCGGSQSVKAADNAITGVDDVRVVADDFDAPWTVDVNARPYSSVNDEVVQTAPTAAREAVPTSQDEVDQVIDLLKETVCAILEYELEYSEVPDQAAIESYLSDRLEELGLEWSAEDPSAAAAELAGFAQTLADEGLSEESFTDLLLLACY